MKREIKKSVFGRPTIDGAGVHLVRVLGNETTRDYDPFLMLDAFDSEDPRDYIEGFPMHPHRGIETVSYLMKGSMEHSDNLGNKGVIGNGESQWMTAGSGIIHQEMPIASDYLLGLQLWINLPKDDKMTHPAYFGITKDMIQVVEEETATVKVISGNFRGVQGVEPKFVQATMLDVKVKPGKFFTMDTNPAENLFIYVVEGEGYVSKKVAEKKSAVLFTKGDEFSIEASSDGLHFVLCSGKPLNEPIAWSGPIVMNTREEINTASRELRNGTFVKADAMK
ncbi:MAG: pirin family protein [Clostridioides sp.]|jgi:redox-sensitive bicupin YhaK (pirin superfamily)|nr:pirin family protein [Clostridioides sp.]